VVVAGEGKVYRIEPSDGITDADRFQKQNSEVELRQDDALFNSVGRTGLYGCCLFGDPRCRDKHWLSEARIVSPWKLSRKTY
jgi:hypothetical protein